MLQTIIYVFSFLNMFSFMIFSKKMNDKNFIVYIVMSMILSLLVSIKFIVESL